MRTSVESSVVPSSIGRFVDDVRVIVSVTGRGMPIQWLPDGRMALVFRTLHGGGRGDVAILGPQSRALFKQPTTVSRVLVVRLRAGWSASVLGVPAKALTDQVIALEQLWGGAGQQLALELLEAQSLAEALARIAEAIARRPAGRPESSSARLARRAARLLEAATISIESVAKHLGVSTRHLRRAFTESIGVGPKDFARGARLRRALQLVGSAPDWSRVAAEAGYYDQSHLIGDFQQLVGLTPEAFVQRHPSPQQTVMETPTPHCWTGPLP